MRQDSIQFNQSLDKGSIWDKLTLDPCSNCSPGDGWQLSETLRLADYGFGYDTRAQEPQPVAPRYLDWHLQNAPAQTWQECEAHARTLARVSDEATSDDANTMSLRHHSQTSQTRTQG